MKYNRNQSFHLSLTLAAFLFVGILTGCSTSAQHEIFFDPDVDRRDVTVQRVAIVPNRLPLNLDQQEMWRRHNWEIVRKEFEDRRFGVVDYNTSVNLFQRSGLPVEDTPGSRNKYAELAEELNVDFIIIPYYGTLFNSRNLVIFNTLYYRTVTTFQIYSRSQNDFLARIDATGEYTLRTGLGFLFLIIPSLILDSVDDAETIEFFTYAGLGITLIDFYNILMVSPEERWKSAFEASIRQGLQPLFQIYPAPTR